MFVVRRVSHGAWVDDVTDEFFELNIVAQVERLFGGVRPELLDYLLAESDAKVVGIGGILQEFVTVSRQKSLKWMTYEHEFHVILQTMLNFFRFVVT